MLRDLSLPLDFTHHPLPSSPPPPPSSSLGFVDTGAGSLGGAAKTMTSGYDSDFHDGDHLRRLLGQRAARADIHDRFSSSEFSDSPSIYSHAYFSPRPSDRTDTNPHTSTYHHATHVRQPSEPRSLMTDRQRLGIPDASSLDLDDDPRSSYLSTMSHEEEPVDDYDDSSTEEADGDDTEVHRVSAYGPKMTVHSRAPWELEDGGSPEPEDQDGVGKRNLLGFGKRDTAKKPWGRDTRSPVDSRPSFDSVQSRGKQSFETASSHVSAGGALLALAQASMSSTSLALSPSPQTSLREKLSLPRFRSRTPSNAGRQELVDSRVYSRTAASRKAHSPAFGVRVSSPTGSEFTRSDSRPSLSEPASPHTPYQHEYHPYANPDLVGSVATHPPTRRLEELHALTYSTPQSPVVARSESAATITESSTVTTMSTLSQTRSQSSVLTPGTSVSSLQPTPEIMAGNRSLSKTRKTPGPIDVASINVIHSRTSEAEPGVQEVTVFSQPDFPSPSVMAPSWPTSPNPAPMKLISLEEAQAQVRERSRSATATASDTGSAPSQSVRAADTGFNQTATSWSRLRSASSNGSAKAKNLTSSSVVDLSTTPTLPSSSSLAGANGLPSKTIARKKSGFMRLFNSKEKMPSSPPPVPSISTDIISSAAPPLPTPSTPSSMTRARKQSAHRVPVPSITPSLLGDSEGSGPSFESRSETVDGAIASGSNLHATRPGSRERQLSSRRNVPGLSIVTNASTSSRSSPSSTTKESPVPILATPKTTLGDNAATAMLSPEFMTLSLRRISTTFGPEFTGRSSDGDHELHRPSLVTDTGTPTTGASLISPRSPPLLYNLEQPMVEVKSVPIEDQSSVIRTLQEQIVAARKAWQHQLWELEGQVRDLKAELEELRVADDGQNYCATCGRGSAAASGAGPRIEDLRKAGVKVGGVVNRPRARTGVGSRFASGT